MIYSTKESRIESLLRKISNSVKEIEEAVGKPEKAQLSQEGTTKDATSDLISRQAALEKVRTMQTYKLFLGDDMILVDKAEVQTELMMLPSVQKKEYSCDGCKFCGQFEYQFPCKVCIRRERDYYARPN